MVKVVVDPGMGRAVVMDAELLVSWETFTPGQCADLADLLEGLNKPGNRGTPLRRLTDLLWALQNDTSVFVVTSDNLEAV